MSAAVTAEPIATKQETAFRVLRADILEGRFAPGERLVIDRLARRLGFSAIPVREAISQLQREGLVETRPHMGPIVTTLAEEDIEEIFGLLEALEVTACRLGFPALNDTHEQELAALAGEMEATANATDWARLNRAFHAVIPRAGNLQRIETQLNRTGEEWERLRLLRFTDSPAGEVEHVNREHRAFLAHVRARDLEACLAWIVRHNRQALKRYQAK